LSCRASPWEHAHPRYLASHPDALARFHRVNMTMGMAAGAFVVVLGLLTLL
jgi:hypothetical protein